MSLLHPVGAATLVLLVLKSTAELWLERLNQRHVRAHADAVPDAYKERLDADTYRRSVDYTQAKSRLRQTEAIWEAGVLGLILFSGLLPWSFTSWTQLLGTSAWGLAAYLFFVGAALALAGLPFSWYAQFRLEARFGFNTTTPRLWWIDRLKGLLLALLLGYPLLVLLLKIVEWTGRGWWLWAWAGVLAFQLLLTLLAPVLILPMFNKFTPLPDGPLRERLLALARRTGFRARSIQVMDGSKRSRHSNAFFTGLGRFRRIVLFDTLLQQLSEPELEAVLAHEIGHYKKRHILKLTATAAVFSLAGFYLMAILAQQPWFYRAFGFAPDHIAVALLLFGLLGGLATFWLSPFINQWSRRYEYQADTFAARTLGEPDSLIAALRKLTEKNLSNLTPHPVYSRFHYTHPTLLERETALRATAT